MNRLFMAAAMEQRGHCERIRIAKEDATPDDFQGGIVI
jgi:hypothetical protein